MSGVVYLTCTAHGTPVARHAPEDLPDRGIHNPPPIRAVESSDLDELGVSLDDPATWFPCPAWARHYARAVECEICDEDGRA